MKKTIIRAFILTIILTAANFDLSAQTTRIRFARGRTSASVSGTIARYGGRTFVLSARYGQYLSANVSSSNGCVTL